MSFKTRYQAVRNATWIWYAVALAFFVMTVNSIQAHVHAQADGLPVAAFFWGGLTVGLIRSAGSAKRKAEAKARG